MKKIVILLILLSTVICLYAQNYNVYPSELVLTLPVNSGEESIFLNFGFYGGVDGPKSFSVTPEGFFLISDTENRRMVVYNEEGTFLKSFSSDSCLAENLWNDESGIIEYSRSNTGYFRFDEKENTEVRVTFSQTEYSRQLLGPPFYLEEAVFAYLKDHSIISIDHPTGDFDINRQNILNEEMTQDLLQSERFKDAEIVIDENNLIFKSGELVSRNYYVFYNAIVNNRSDHLFTPLSANNDEYMHYLGKDINGNFYWNLDDIYIIIFKPHGMLFEKIRYIDNHDESKIYVDITVQPNGDLYELAYDEEGVYIYYIPNTWEPIDWQPLSQSDNPTATVTANGLRMRDNPVTTNSIVVASLNQGIIVEILGQSATEETIGTNTAYWFRIRTPDGLDGWVFGAFLEMQ